jgi:HK97 family phage major capsid protein
MVKSSIGQAHALYETSVRSHEFILAVKHLMAAHGRPAQARAEAEHEGASERVLEIMKDASAGTTSGDTGSWGSELATYQQAVAAFTASLGNYSAFDRILNDGSFYRMPMRTRVSVTSTAATASIVDEGASKPVGMLTLDVAQLAARKAVGTVVVSNELVRLSNNAALDLLSRELRRAVGIVTDQAFISAIVDEPGVASSGATGDFVQDIAGALDNIEVGSDMQLYLLLPAATVKRLAMQRDSGGWLFPDLAVNGGAIQGVRVIVSNATDDGVLIDSRQVAADSDTIRIDTSDQCMLDLAGGDSPDFSLWQKNCVAVRAERYFGCALLRPGGAAVISGLNNTL